MFLRPFAVGPHLSAVVHAGSCGGGLDGSARILALGRLGGVGAQETIFQRRAIESPDDRLHFVGCRRFDECESLGFLCFVVPDHFNGVGDEVFGGEPLLNIVGGNPCGEISQKNGKAHSVDLLLRWLDLAVLQGEDSDL
jgi:hypothetical protein